MKIKIRQELKKDHKAVFVIIEQAFKNEKLGDHREQFLVERLRKSKAYIPELSLVAEIDSKLVGHILLTKIKIENKSRSFDSLALAPVSVRPDYQSRGVGAKLIESAHNIAKRLGYKSIVLLGHKNYYPRFGYKKASYYGIKLPFEAPDENCMVIELVKNGLDNVSGLVDYPKEFYQ